MSNRDIAIGVVKGMSDEQINAFITLFVDDDLLARIEAENIAYDSETQERMVVYKPLYERKDGHSIWVRPEKMFLSEIPERTDNITGQKHRFELITEIEKDYTK